MADSPQPTQKPTTAARLRARARPHLTIPAAAGRRRAPRHRVAAEQAAPFRRRYPRPPPSPPAPGRRGRARAPGRRRSGPPSFCPPPGVPRAGPPRAEVVGGVEGAAPWGVGRLVSPASRPHIEAADGVATTACRPVEPAPCVGGGCRPNRIGGVEPRAKARRPGLRSRGRSESAGWSPGLRRPH
jgi:hypothetical protein